MENIGLDKTVIRVLAFSGNSDLASESLSKVIFQGSSSVLNTTWNGKYQQKPDVLAVGPYVGPNDDALMYQRWLETGENQTIYPKLDGAAADIKARYRANTDTCLTFYLQNFKQIAGTFGLPLVGYEGGQQMDTNADQWATNPAMYDEYLYFFDQVNEAGLILLNQYTLYSAFQSNQAQGLAPGPTAGPENTYPKFKAVKDWMHTRWASAGY